MVFSSYLFVFYFLPLALLLYYALPWRRVRHSILTVLSYVFYGWANPAFVPLMLVSTFVDYAAGLVQAYNGVRDWKGEPPLLEENGPRTKTQRVALVTSLVLNLSLLGFFKYFNFASDNLRAMAGWIGVAPTAWDGALRVTLPLGISFYTFQSMSYSIDVYRGHTRAMKSWIDYSCFVAMFQQLVAGPIVRFSEIADQLRARSHTVEKFARGVALFSLGLAMKVLLANPCGKIADTVWATMAPRAVDAWYGMLAYSMQILFDFAGYSEMAIGLGLMMGFVFAKNFETPYQSESITDFWRRWHISLSTWLRDYLYISLGGNRRGPSRTTINLFLTMLLGGLWHGASWNFLIWGAIHGGLLAWERKRSDFFRPFSKYFGRSAIPSNLTSESAPTDSLAVPQWKRAYRIAATFTIVMLTWVFFRAPDLPAAMNFLGSMFGWQGAGESAGLIGGLIYQPYYLVSLCIAALIAWSFPTVWAWTQRLSAPKALLCAGALWLSLAVLMTQSYNPFIYFIF